MIKVIDIINNGKPADHQIKKIRIHDFRHSHASSTACINRSNSLGSQKSISFLTSSLFTASLTLFVFIRNNKWYITGKIKKDDGSYYSYTKLAIGRNSSTYGYLQFIPCLHNPTACAWANICRMRSNHFRAIVYEQRHTSIFAQYHF